MPSRYTVKAIPTTTKSPQRESSELEFRCNPGCAAAANLLRSRREATFAESGMSLFCPFTSRLGPRRRHFSQRLMSRARSVSARTMERAPRWAATAAARLSLISMLGEIIAYWKSTTAGFFARQKKIARLCCAVEDYFWKRKIGFNVMSYVPTRCKIGTLATD